MDKIRVILQNNKDFVTQVENYNASDLAQSINETENHIVQIGDIVVNRHHIECIVKIDEVV